jgi:aspartyl protease family protein
VSGDDAVSFFYLIGCLVLVASAFLVHRLPLGQTLKMAAAWVLIFIVAFAVVALRDDFRALGRRLLGDLRGEPVLSGQAVRIARAPDGHYWVTASLNGEPVRFLVDSGATNTGVDRRTARRAGIVPDGGDPMAVNTANGITFVHRAVAERFSLGPIERRDMKIWVSQNDDDMNLLGMNFLSSLSAWGIEDGQLVLRP